MHVAQKLADWIPAANEISETRWIDAPEWFFRLPPGEDVPTRKHGPPDDQVTQLEFSSKTVHLWARLLSRIILELESYATEAQKRESEGDTLGFKSAMDTVSNRCTALFCYLTWGASVIKTLLTKTTLASNFNGFTPGGIPGQDVGDEDLYDPDESDDLNPEPYESSGGRVLRYLKSIIAWNTAIASLTTPIYSKIIRSELSLSLLEVPHASSDIANLDETCDAYFNSFSSKASFISKDQVISILKPCLPQTFPGAVHAEATLMGLLMYFSSSSSRVAFQMPLRDDHVVVLEKLLEPATTENIIAVGRKCCWCCDRLRFQLLLDNKTRFKFPGSNGAIYPWSPPRVGVDVKVLQKLEDALFEELRRVIEREANYLWERQHPRSYNLPFLPF